MGVSVALIGCPSKRNLVVATAIPWKETNSSKDTKTPTQYYIFTPTAASSGTNQSAFHSPTPDPSSEP